MLKYITFMKVSVFVDGFPVMNYGVCLYENSWKSPSAEAACSKRLCRRVLSSSHSERLSCHALHAVLYVYLAFSWCIYAASAHIVGRAFLAFLYRDAVHAVFHTLVCLFVEVVF